MNLTKADRFVLYQKNTILEKPLINAFFITSSSWAGNKAAMWRTADPYTWVQIPLRPFIHL